MAITLTDEETWAFLGSAHTGIAVTLRRDGTPVALPTWFAVIHGRVYLRTPSRASKLARIRHDPRGSFLVETGSHWAELKAVHMTGLFAVDEDPATRQLLDHALDAKYAGFRTPREAMPNVSQRHYADERIAVRFDHDERILSWDNSKLRLKTSL